MNSSSTRPAQSVVLTLPAHIVKEADSLLPKTDVGVLTLRLLESYLRHQKKKYLAKQYQQYYQSLSDDERAEEKDLLSDFAALDSEMNAFIEAEAAHGNS